MPAQVIFSLFCGVTVPPNVMPAFFRSWLYHLDPFTYIIEGLVTNELHNLPIVVRRFPLSPRGNARSCSCFVRL